MCKLKEVSFPRPPSKQGGPGSFQMRFENELKKRGWIVTYGNKSINPRIVFIIGGTKNILWLMRCKLKGVKIVHRLDGLNWQHRVNWPGIVSWIRSEIRELNVRLIRKYFADSIVYQTNFICNWWGDNYGLLNKKSYIINNAVDLNEFCPDSLKSKKSASNEIICVEGTVRGEPAYHILSAIKSWLVNVYGNASDSGKLYLINKSCNNIKFFGSVPRVDVPKVLKKGGIFLNLEIIPPCPNAVIEAMAKGLPIVSYDTGSMRELVGEGAGILIPYESDPWKLEMPNTGNLEEAIRVVFSSYESYSQNARNRAELLFNIDHMVDKYIDVFDQVCSENLSD